MPVGILKISPVQKGMAHLHVLANMCALPRAEYRANMAIYHLSASIVKRSAGRSVVAAAAYRAAAKIEDLTTGLVHDYTRKQGVDHSEIRNCSRGVRSQWVGAITEAKKWLISTK